MAVLISRLSDGDNPNANTDEINAVSASVITSPITTFVILSIKEHNLDCLIVFTVLVNFITLQ